MKEAGNSQIIPMQGQSQGGGGGGHHRGGFGYSWALTGTRWLDPLLSSHPNHCTSHSSCPRANLYACPFLPRQFCTPGSGEVPICWTLERWSTLAGPTLATLGN